jgi:hypothetical protein
MEHKEIKINIKIAITIRNFSFSIISYFKTYYNI